MATSASLATRKGKAPLLNDTPSCALLDLRCYIAVAGRCNATTAWSKTNTGLPIAVTFCAARPPSLAHFSVDCPGLEFDDLFLPPKIISWDADLIVLRVPRNVLSRINPRHNDYFVYRMHPQHPRLDLLRNPYPARLGDNEIAVLSCDSDDGKYVVAGLKTLDYRRLIFELHVYRSTDDGKPGNWTSQLLSVEEPLRDRVCPVPDSAERRMFHLTTKVITLGGDKDTVGWVDLWRGILLCDVLSESPKLRDLPLPLPAKGNWSRFLDHGPHYVRDITVNQHKDTIKFVEMEITQPRQVAIDTSASDADSYYVWMMRRQECPESYKLVPGRWRATTYSMPIPVASWGHWHRGCSVRSVDLKLPVDNPRHYKLLRKLMRSSGNKEQEAKEATWSLGCLCMAYPVLSVDDDDVVYLLSEGVDMKRMEAVFSVDVRAGNLRGVAKLNTERYYSFSRCYIAIGILQTSQD